MRRVVLLASIAAICAAPAFAADFPVKKVSRDQFAAVCDFPGQDTSGWTSCTNLATKTIYLDEDAGQATTAWLIKADTAALANGVHGYSGDPATCGCDLPADVGIEVAKRVNTRILLQPELSSGGIK